METKTCKWEYITDNYCDYFKTECGEGYCIDDDDELEASYNYCPNCGKKIVVEKRNIKDV